GLAALAVTDHDTLEGVPLAQAAAAGTGLGGIPGVGDSPPYRGRGPHPPAFFLGPNNEPPGPPPPAPARPRGGRGGGPGQGAPARAAGGAVWGHGRAAARPGRDPGRGPGRGPGGCGPGSAPPGPAAGQGGAGRLGAGGVSPLPDGPGPRHRVSVAAAGDGGP